MKMMAKMSPTMKTSSTTILALKTERTKSVEDDLEDPYDDL